MTPEQLQAIRARLDAALTYEPSEWNEEEGAYISPSDKKDEDAECPLCDGQGYVWQQRYDAKETIAATVVAYGIGEGLARAEEWVEQAPADIRALLDEVERLTALTERQDSAKDVVEWRLGDDCDEEFVYYEAYPDSDTGLDVVRFKGGKWRWTMSREQQGFCDTLDEAKAAAIAAARGMR
jgi:hypothetical protein